MTPTPIAWIALLGWPLLVWLLYARLGPGRALIWSVLGAYMFLPELLRIDLPLLPDLDKHTLPALAAAVISWLKLHKGLPVFGSSRLTNLLICCFLISPFVTVLTNRDPIFGNGMLLLPGLRLYDSFSVVASQALLILPLFLARRDLATASAIRDLLLALVIGGLLYALPVLLEARLSPQLHIWIYGYFQHDFVQAMRFGGFRPFVFMPHGLWVAFFILSALLATVALLRIGPAAARGRFILLLPLLLLLLVLCKSFGPIFYALIALPLLLLVSNRSLLLVAALFGGIVLFYPLLRGAHLVPVEEVFALAERLSADRAQSFGFRLWNEEMLLARAAERPWFGWGSYGRGFVLSPETGQPLTVADGAWIIHIGAWGWLGFLAQFGLLAMPLWLLLREDFAGKGRVSRRAASLALIHALNLVDLLPNATLIPLTWLTAGALLGYAEALRSARQAGNDRPLANAVASRPASPARSRTVI